MNRFSSDTLTTVTPSLTALLTKLLLKVRQKLAVHLNMSMRYRNIKASRDLLDISLLPLKGITSERVILADFAQYFSLGSSCFEENGLSSSIQCIIFLIRPADFSIWDGVEGKQTAGIFT